MGGGERHEALCKLKSKDLCRGVPEEVLKVVLHLQADPVLTSPDFLISYIVRNVKLIFTFHKNRFCTSYLHLSQYFCLSINTMPTMQSNELIRIDFRRCQIYLIVALIMN